MIFFFDLLPRQRLPAQSQNFVAELLHMIIPASCSFKVYTEGFRVLALTRTVIGCKSINQTSNIMKPNGKYVFSLHIFRYMTSLLTVFGTHTGNVRIC